MKDFLTLRPGVGIGDIRFGFSFESVKDFFGEPSEAEIDAEENIIRWAFSSLCLNVYFCEDVGYRLRSFETDHPDVTIWDTKIIRFPTAYILELFEHHGIQPPDVEDFGTGETLYNYDDLGLNVWCEGDMVTSVQMSVLFDSSGNEYAWPA